ncbi:hypothetical protein PGTUg99_023068 [Puccinia graminis f. sp. tritici]|uniref:AAA+ ATPase domain-containing protein n=1 Tax=Puccinia graminis f. sp. tritici TaxID=56615 RepID=A0A5B0S1M0_PUCGR|nr:hypothetical protein PGTUg99_023068 [Puccinia graminis f. sp. tritici]
MHSILTIPAPPTRRVKSGPGQFPILACPNPPRDPPGCGYPAEERLSRRLKSDPQLTLILGPPSSGKTALARHVASQTRPDGTPEFHPLTVNLRAVDRFHDGSFLRAFVRNGIRAAEIDPFWERPFRGFDDLARVLYSNPPQDVPSSLMAAEVFNELAHRLQPLSYYTRESVRAPVLIIDEANHFRKMSDKAIMTFLDFAVRMTTKEKKMHIIMTSSDSFFLEWIGRCINPTYLDWFVLGDMTRDEAHRYFLHALETDCRLSEEKKAMLGSVDSDTIYRLTGGRPIFIESYIRQVHQSGFFVDPLRFQPVRQAYGCMFNSLGDEPKTYGKAETLAVSSLLVNSPGHHTSYGNLAIKLGLPVVEEMFERNFLQYRPPSTFSRDLDPSPHETIVTAQSQPCLRAMEWFVNSHRNK